MRRECFDPGDQPMGDFPRPAFVIIAAPAIILLADSVRCAQHKQTHLLRNFVSTGENKFQEWCAAVVRGFRGGGGQCAHGPFSSCGEIMSRQFFLNVCKYSCSVSVTVGNHLLNNFCPLASSRHPVIHGDITCSPAFDTSFSVYISHAISYSVAEPWEACQKGVTVDYDVLVPSSRPHRAQGILHDVDP